MEPGCAPTCPLSSMWPLTVGRSNSLGKKPGAVKSYKAGFAGTKGSVKLGAGTCCTGVNMAGNGQVALLDTISDSVLGLALPQPGLQAWRSSGREP